MSIDRLSIAPSPSPNPNPTLTLTLTLQFYYSNFERPRAQPTPRPASAQRAIRPPSRRVSDLVPCGCETRLLMYSRAVSVTTVMVLYVGRSDDGPRTPRPAVAGIHTLMSHVDGTMARWLGANVGGRNLDGSFAFRRFRLSAECSRRRRFVASPHHANRTRPVAARAVQLTRHWHRAQTTHGTNGSACQAHTLHGWTPSVSS